MKENHVKKSFGAWSPRGRIAHFKGPTEPAPVLEFLVQTLKNTPEDRLRELIALGSVYVNKLRVSSGSLKVSSEDLLRVHLEPKRYEINLEKIKTAIETENFKILVKPCGIPMHATLDNAVENLAAAFSERLFVTHRLDVPTSGLVLLAKTKDYQVVFNNLLLAGEVNKTYQVLTLKEPPLGRLINGMRVEDRAPKKIISYADFISGNHEKSEQYIHCELEIISISKIKFDMGRPVPTSAPGFLSLVKLITGRTHQIRAQFSFAGCPIIGDEMYGGMPSSIFGLHSARLSFTDPLLRKEIVAEDFKKF